MVDDFHDYRKKYKSQIKDAVHFIRKNYVTKIKLKQISKSAALSMFHFSRIFKTVTRMTPFEYVTRRRIARAKELLLMTDVPITEISFDIGFESMTTFSNLFKKRVGMSPSEFRKRYKKRRKI